MVDLLTRKPEDPVEHMINYLSELKIDDDLDEAIDPQTNEQPEKLEAKETNEEKDEEEAYDEVASVSETFICRLDLRKIT